MSRGLNKVMVIGHLGRDPEMRYTPSGRPVTTFTVAVSRSWNTADGEPDGVGGTVVDAVPVVPDVEASLLETAAEDPAGSGSPAGTGEAGGT